MQRRRARGRGQGGRSGARGLAAEVRGRRWSRLTQRRGSGSGGEGERGRGRARWRGYGVCRAAEGGGAREGVARGDRSGSSEGGTKGSVELAMAHPRAVRHK